MKFVQEGLQFVQPFVSFHLDVGATGDFFGAQRDRHHTAAAAAFETRERPLPSSGFAGAALDFFTGVRRDSFFPVSDTRPGERRQSIKMHRRLLWAPSGCPREGRSFASSGLMETRCLAAIPWQERFGGRDPGGVTSLGHASGDGELDRVVGRPFALAFPLLLFVLEDLHPLSQRHLGRRIHAGLLLKWFWGKGGRGKIKWVPSEPLCINRETYSDRWWRWSSRSQLFVKRQ